MEVKEGMRNLDLDWANHLRTPFEEKLRAERTRRARNVMDELSEKTKGLTLCATEVGSLRSLCYGQG